MMISAVYLLIYAAITSTGLYLLKAAGGITTPQFWVGGFLYGSGFLLWLYILRLYPLSFAFPVAAGSVMIATMLLGVFWLHEPTSLWQWSGTGLIILGIILQYANLTGVK